MFFRHRNRLVNGLLKLVKLFIRQDWSQDTQPGTALEQRPHPYYRDERLLLACGANLIVPDGTLLSRFLSMIESLTNLNDDETLLVQSGKPVGVFKTHSNAPRVLIANSSLIAATSGASLIGSNPGYGRPL